MQLTVLVQGWYESSEEFAQVAAVAERLRDHLGGGEMARLVTELNQPGASSALIQRTFLQFARDLGFRDESKGLFAEYDNSALRPDYFMPLGATGILMEVERGKTTINNMDLLDFWKCHLCEHAQYLFLLVPTALRQNPVARPRNEYIAVTRRLRTFFVPRNYTNVRGAFVFGY
ncbi:MAG TPA: hypothetical protein VM938_09730 [Acidimicrobiales bacterium]|nr:hypothetical protein [Acidimicrobiales bacterium]